MISAAMIQVILSESQAKKLQMTEWATEKYKHDEKQLKEAIRQINFLCAMDGLSESRMSAFHNLCGYI